MHLFVIYIGGSHANSLIELHDMRFIVANSIEETFDALRGSWFGTPASLHLDAWGILKYADGHGVCISKDKPQDRNQLFFVNLGGYDQKQFTELHKNIFVVAADKFEAKQKALQQIPDWGSPHRDYLYEVDHLLNLNFLLEKEGYTVQLDNKATPKPFEFTCCYTPIGKD